MQPSPPNSTRSTNTRSLYRNLDSSRRSKKSMTPRCSQNVNNNQVSKEAVREILLNDNLDEIERYATRALMGEKLPVLPQDKLALIAKDLENRRAFFVDKGFFAESLQAKAAIENVKALQLEAVKLQAQRVAQADIYLRKGHTSTDYTIFHHKMGAAKDQMEMRFEDRINLMKERHEQEKIDLEKEWNSPQKQRMYNHDSQRLIELKYLKKKLIDANQFEKASQIELEIAAMTKKEREESARQWATDYRRACETLAYRQDKELKSLAYDKTMKKELFKAKVETGDIVFDNRKRALKINESIVNDKEKFWRLHKKSIKQPFTGKNGTRQAVPVLLSLPMPK